MTTAIYLSLIIGNYYFLHKSYNNKELKLCVQHSFFLGSSCACFIYSIMINSL